MKDPYRTIVPVFIIGILFIACTFLVTTYDRELKDLIGEQTTVSVLIYIVLAATTTVFAPLTSIPLIPAASLLWGAPLAAVASIAGWMIGSLIAFALSRRFGRVWVEDFVSPEALERLEARIVTKHIFWNIVFLRLVVPVDVLSYVLGLFKHISWQTYTGATLIGITPFAFVFAYGGTLSPFFQLIGVTLLGIFLFFVWKK